MDKKAFNKITKKCFIDYGFSKVKNKYFLQLDDVTIEVAFRSWRCVKSFNYVLYVNEFNKLYNNSLSAIIIEIKMEHSPFLQGYHAHEILFEEYSEDEYEKMLSNMLHTYFDPYKENAIPFIKNNMSNILRNEVKEFLKSVR